MSKNSPHFPAFLQMAFAIIMLFPFLSAFGQANCTVSGVIVDQTGIPVPYASVLISQQDAEFAGTLTDSSGCYTLKVPQSDSSYQLIYNYMGGDTYKTSFVADTRKLKLDTLTLDYPVEVLDAITVEGRRAPVQASAERTVYANNDGPTDNLYSVLELLDKISSVSVDRDKNISLRGNSNILVMVNGVPTDKSWLETMYGNNVKQIEIIQNPGAQYDAEGTGGIINVILKDNRFQGLSGSVSANYGFNHFVKGNISLQYIKKGYTFRFGYNTKYEDDIIKGTLERKINASGMELQQEFRTLRNVFNNNINVGGDFRFNQHNLLKIDLRLRLPRLNTRQQFHNVYEINQSEWEENRYSNVSWNRENLEGTIFYRHSFKSSNWMEWTGSVSKTWGHRPSFYFLEGDSVGMSNSGGSPLITFGQGDFTVMKPYGTWSSGFKFTYRQNDIFHEFYNMRENGWEQSNDLSTDLMHREFIPAIYMLFSSRRLSGAPKPLSWKAGLRVEYSGTKLHSTHGGVDKMNHYIFIAPSASLSYEFKAAKKIVAHSITAAWSNRISRPTYPQLNPYMSMIDANTFEQGNMYLKPETKSQLEISYHLKTKMLGFWVNAYGNQLNNNITQVAELRDDILLLTYVNGKYEVTAGLDFALNVLAARWFEFTASNSTWFTDTKGNAANMDLDNRGVTNGSWLKLNFKPIKGMNIQLQYFVTTPEYFPQFTTELSHYMNVGISQKFLKNNLTVSLLLTDVFNTNDWDIHSANRIYQLTHHSYNKSRMLWLGISYNFNPPAAMKASPPADSKSKERLKLGL